MHWGWRSARVRTPGWCEAAKTRPSVSAEIELSADHPVHALLAEQGIEADDGEPLILRRSLKADGGSRAFVGAASVPAGIASRDRRAGRRGPRPARRARAAQSARAPGLARCVRRARRRRRLRAAWSDGHSDRSRSAAGARRSSRPPNATATILRIPLAEIDALAPEAGEETRLAEERAAMQAGLKAGRKPERTRRAAGWVGRRAGPASACCAADRARSRRSSAAGGGAGGAGPRGDRGERGGGQDRPRRRRSDVRSGAAGGGRGAAVRHSRACRASIASSRMRWPSLRTGCAPSFRRSRPAGSGSPSSTASWSRRGLRYSESGRRRSAGSGTRRRRSWTQPLRPSFTR